MHVHSKVQCRSKLVGKFVSKVAEKSMLLPLEQAVLLSAALVPWLSATLSCQLSTLGPTPY